MWALTVWLLFVSPAEPELAPSFDIASFQTEEACNDLASRLRWNERTHLLVACMERPAG